jgi:hypothetical protein
MGTWCLCGQGCMPLHFNGRVRHSNTLRTCIRLRVPSFTQCCFTSRTVARPGKARSASSTSVSLPLPLLTTRPTPSRSVPPTLSWVNTPATTHTCNVSEVCSSSCYQPSVGKIHDSCAHGVARVPARACACACVCVSHRPVAPAQSELSRRPYGSPRTAQRPPARRRWASSC